jgi:DNA replication protein DnaC
LAEIVRFGLEQVSAFDWNGCPLSVECAAGAQADRSFENRLLDLIECERVDRDDRRFKERIRKAGLSQTARLEELQSATARGLDRATIEFLGQDAWVKDKRNVIVTGATGVGKTFIACALAHRACAQGFRSRFFRLPRLLGGLAIARADGTHASRLAQLARLDVLVLDDWGLAPLQPSAKRDLLEILDDRYQKRSTIIAAQLPVENWHDWIADPPLADAILDRIVHNAYNLNIKGESQRKTRGITQQAPLSNIQ